MTHNTALANRFEGRLFVEEGRLYFVLEVDVKQNMARVGFSAGGERHIKDMSINDVAARLASTGQLRLDDFSGESTKDRIEKQSDGYYFKTRDGMKGPFDSRAKAEAALKHHILSAQQGAVGLSS